MFPENRYNHHRRKHGWKSKGDIHRATTLVFHEHRVQLRSLGDSYRSICLAASPSPTTGRSVAAPAHPTQLPSHWLAFLVPGVVSSDLPLAFAYSAAYGDMVAAILAVLALISLPRAAGVVIACIFSLWGWADLLNTFYQANHAGLVPGQLGATYFIPTFIVPLLLITHGLIFRILLQHPNVHAVQESCHLA